MATRVFLGICIVAVIFLLYVLVNLFLDSKRKQKRARCLRWPSFSILDVALRGVVRVSESLRMLPEFGQKHGSAIQCCG